MRPIAELKQDFEVTKGLEDIVDVLKTAAMIQFRSFQFKEKPNEIFIKELESCLLTVRRTGYVKHPYFFDRKSMPSMVVAVTSDEGFLGELNTLLINASIDQRKSAADEIVVLGERGARYLEDMDQRHTPYPGISDDIKYAEVERIRDYVLDSYKKKFGRVVIVYPQFVSLTSQKVTVFQLCPFQFSNEQEKLFGNLRPSEEEVLIEPSAYRVLECLIEMWAGFTLLNMLWSAKQSEFAARIMHLEGSTQELAHMKQKLSFEYFRQVHSLRDKVIREISASKILLNKN